MVGRACRWRNTRRRLIGAAALAGPGALAACGAPGTAPPAAPERREVALSYVTGWSGGARGEYVAQAIQAFNQEHPGLTVRADAWVGNVATAALASAAAGTLQDVMLNSNDVFLHLARAGGMPDLTPVLKAQRVSMGDLVQLPSTYTYRGKQHGLPFHLLVQSLVVNKTLLRQHGAPLPDGRTTFAQLLDAMRRVARPAENVYGYHTSGVAGNWAYWWPWVWGFGGDRWTPDLRRSRLGEPASIEGLQFYVDLMYRHGVATPLSDAGTPLPEGVAFASGNLAVAHTSSPGAALDREVGGRFEWDVMYHPLGPKTNKRHVFTNNQAHIVTSGAAGRGVVEQATRLAVWLPRARGPRTWWSRSARTRCRC